MTADDFGDRMKEYESYETSRKFLPTLPVYARIDGRGFSKFTKGMDRPYDIRMSTAMLQTTKYLVKHTHAKIGYCQSDEISLVWKAVDYKSSIFFDGKIMKLTSVCAALATVAFIDAIHDQFVDYSKYTSRMPHFDCRVCQFPNETEAANMVLWRTSDATKNAVSMAARSFYSHKELHGKGQATMQEMIFQKGMNFNDYPAFFKQGTFVRRMSEQKSFTDEEKEKLKNFKNVDTEKTFERFEVKAIDMPIFSKVINRVGVIFNNEEPLTA